MRFLVKRQGQKCFKVFDLYFSRKVWGPAGSCRGRSSRGIVCGFSSLNLNLFPSPLICSNCAVFELDKYFCILEIYRTWFWCFGLFESRGYHCNWQASLVLFNENNVVSWLSASEKFFQPRVDFDQQAQVSLRVFKSLQTPNFGHSVVFLFLIQRKMPVIFIGDKSSTYIAFSCVFSLVPSREPFVLFGVNSCCKNMDNVSAAVPLSANTVGASGLRGGPALHMVSSDFLWPQNNVSLIIIFVRRLVRESYFSGLTRQVGRHMLDDFHSPQGSCSPNFVSQTKWWGRGRGTHGVSALLLVWILASLVCRFNVSSQIRLMFCSMFSSNVSLHLSRFARLCLPNHPTRAQERTSSVLQHHCIQVSFHRLEVARCVCWCESDVLGPLGWLGCTLLQKALLVQKRAGIWVEIFLARFLFPKSYKNPGHSPWERSADWLPVSRKSSAHCSYFLLICELMSWESVAWQEPVPSRLSVNVRAKLLVPN